MNDKVKSSSPYEDISKRTSGHHPKLGLMVGGATLAVVLIIAGLVFLWPSGDDNEDASAGTGAAAAQNASQETAAVQVSGEDLPPLPDTGGFMPAPGQDEAVGFSAPTLTGQTFDESEVVIDPADGSAKMIVFLAHWCPHCQAEVPIVQEWIDSGDVPEGFEIESVSTGVDSTRPNYSPSNWLASAGWTPPVLLDDEAQTAAISYGLTGFPYFVILDAEGNVWQRGSGEIPLADLQRMADEVTSGVPSTGGTGSNEGLQSPVTLEGAEG
jgi:cytochrome c biogenesis protein CcmG/thiol:disulfide interchange protein DsbE